MTVQNETRLTVLSGNGSTVAFPFAFKVFTAGELSIYLQSTNAVTLLNGSQYSISLNSNQNTSPGGTVTLTTAPASGEKVLIKSNVNYLQERDINNQYGLLPEEIESALDKETIQALQLKDIVARCIKLPLPKYNKTTEIPFSSQSLAGKALIFDASENINTAILSTNGTVADVFPTLAQSSGAGFIGATGGGSVQDAINFLSAMVKDTVAMLRASNIPGRQACFVSGYYAAGDGGGGFYVRDAADISSVDNGASVIVDAIGGRWKAQLTNGMISVRRCGLKPEAGFNNSALLSTAIAAFNTLSFDRAATEYEFLTRVSIPGGKQLIGNRAKLKKTNGDYLFEITGSGTLIDGFEFFGNSTLASTGFCIQRTDLASIQYTYIQNITTYYAGTFLADVSGANLAINTHLINISCRLHRGYGIYLVKNFAYLYLTKVNIDYVGSDIHNLQAFTFIGCEGGFLTKCDTTGGLVDATNTSQHGFAFQNCKAIWFIDCMADTVGGYGFYGVSNNQYIYFVGQCVSSLCGLTAMYIAGGSDYEINGFFANGRKGMTYSPTAYGMRFDSAGRVNINKLKILNAKTDGVYLSSTYATISGGRIDLCGGQSLNSTGVSVLLMTGVTCNSDSATNVTHSYATMQTTACQGKSGNLISLSGVGSV